MEYVFGIVERHGIEVENVETIGSEHTNLTSYQNIIREYPDNKITDHFKIVEKYSSTEDGAGNCYDWYTITEHYRIEDKSALNSKTEARLQYVAMMADIDLPDNSENSIEE